MQLLMTYSYDDFYPLLYYNTCTEVAQEIKFDIERHDGFSTGLIYSGIYLCFSVTFPNTHDIIVIYDIYNENWSQFDCKTVMGSTSIISIYPGKLYIDSTITNSIVCVDFDPVNLSYFSDLIHYSLDLTHDHGINSLCVYNNTWFIASETKHKILDLTNDRTVFSDTYKPNSIFFNSNHRLCFLEEEKGLFHCGDDIFYVGNNPTAVIEDRKKGGYWITCDTDLKFVDYNGDIPHCIDLSEYGWRFNNIVEAEGKFRI